MSAPRRAELAEVALPDFGMPQRMPELAAERHRERLERLRERAEAAGHDDIVVMRSQP